MKHIIITNFIGAAGDDFSVRVCNAVYGVLGRPFDLDYGVMVPADRRPGEPDSYWYEIHPEVPSDDEFYTIEPDGLSEESRRVFAVLKPIFEEIGATKADPAVGQEFFLGYNWLRVVEFAPVTFTAKGEPVPATMQNPGESQNLALGYDPF